MRLPLLVVPVLLLAPPLVAGSKTFDKSKEFREEQKGYLNVKFNTYAQMFEEPKGTKCDWVFSTPDFNIDDIRKSGLTMTVASIAAHDGYFGYAGLWGNAIVQSFESGLGNLGIRVTKLNSASGSNSAPMGTNGAMAKQYQEIYRQNPQAVEMMVDQKLAQSSVIDQQMDKDLYEEDKKAMGVEKAVERAKQRQEDRRTKVRNQMLGISTPSAPEAPKVAQQNPEDQPGYQLVFYVTESKAEMGVWVSTNSTTAEFILLKDGKPVLAGRHNAASMGWGGGSGSKCGQSLVSAFNITKKS